MTEGAFCVPKDFGHGGTVCVCNSSYCDFVGPIERLKSGQYASYTSTLSGLRMERKIENFNSSDVEISVVIDHSVRYQKMHGFGGAFTDSAGINIKSLELNLQEYLMR